MTCQPSLSGREQTEAYELTVDLDNERYRTRVDSLLSLQLMISSDTA